MTKIPIDYAPPVHVLERQGTRAVSTKREQVLVNLGQFENEYPLNSMQI